MLPQRRLQGPTPWVLALMVSFTLLAAAAGLVLVRAADGITGAIAGRVTVQLLDADPEKRAAQASTIRRAAAAAPFVRGARIVERDEMLAMMAQWFGTSQGGTDPVVDALPLPALVDIDLMSARADDQLQRLGALVRELAPDARIIPHAQWLEPVARLIRLLAWLVVALALLMILASVAIVMLTARAALNLHMPTIHMLHQIGATDRQICRMFQRRIAIDSGYGIALGSVGAALVLVLIGWQLRGVTAGLADGAAIGPWGLAMLAALPLLALTLAALTARITLMRRLARLL